MGRETLLITLITRILIYVHKKNNNRIPIYIFDSMKASSGEYKRGTLIKMLQKIHLTRYIWEMSELESTQLYLRTIL